MLKLKNEYWKLFFVYEQWVWLVRCDFVGFLFPLNSEYAHPYSVSIAQIQEALKRKLNARIEYAKFLQETVKEMAKEVKNSRSGELKNTAEDLDEFMNKVNIYLSLLFWVSFHLYFLHLPNLELLSQSFYLLFPPPFSI